MLSWTSNRSKTCFALRARSGTVQAANCPNTPPSQANNSRVELKRDYFGLLLNYSGWLLLVVLLAWFVPYGQWLAILLLILLLLQEKYQLTRLLACLLQRQDERSSTAIPVAYGKWGDVYDLLYQNFQRGKEKSTRYHSFMRRIQRIATRMDDGVMLLDGAMRIVWFNRAAKDIFALHTGNQDLGLPIYHVIRQQKFSSFLHAKADAVELKIGTRQLEVRLIYVTEGSYMLLARDFSPQQQLDQMRKDFIANISHELRTPLTVLMGYLQQLEDKYPADRPDDNTEAVAVERMLQQCMRMTKLLSDLTTLSKMELDNAASDQEAFIDMAVIMRQLESEATILNQSSKHELIFNCTSTMGLLGNSSQLTSAFTNLLANAIYYTKPGGRIELSWEVDDLGRGLFNVKDNGIGIAERHLSRITERFFRIDDSPMNVAGVGLGLSITKRALKNHNGELIVYSKEGIGSHFICRFASDKVISLG